MPLVKTNSHFPMSHGIKWRQVYLDWQRFQEIILLFQWRKEQGEPATKRQQAVPLSQLHRLSPLAGEESDRDAIRDFIYRVFYLQFCEGLEKEACPTAEINSYRQQLAQWEIPSTDYSHNQSSFNRYLQSRQDIPTSDKHWLIAHESERQWLILDDLFPEDGDFAICRHHFKAINKLREQLHQAALFGQVQSTLIARIKQHSKETLTTTGQDYQTNYIIDVIDNHLQITEIAKLKKVIVHTKVWLAAQNEFSDDLDILTTPTGSQFHLQAECKVLVPLDENDSAIERKPVTLKISQPQLEKMAKTPTAQEALIADIDKHINELDNGIQYNKRRHSFFSSVFTDPRHYIGGMSANEIALKKEKKQVLNFAKDLLSSQCTAETFAYVLSKNPRFRQGFFSRTRKLYQRILGALESAEISMIEDKLKAAALPSDPTDDSLSHVR